MAKKRLVQVHTFIILRFTYKVLYVILINTNVFLCILTGDFLFNQALFTFSLMMIFVIVFSQGRTDIKHD